MPQHQGRGQGWEEKIQQPTLQRYLEGKSLKIFPEFPIEATEFKNLKKSRTVRLDFLVDFGPHYEIIECKNWNHPIFNVAEAFGQAVTYRSLVKAKNLYPSGIKDIHLALCFVNGYGEELGIWTHAHDELMASYAHAVHEPLKVYLIGPKLEEFANESHWWDLEKHEVKKELIYGA